MRRRRIGWSVLAIVFAGWLSGPARGSGIPDSLADYRSWNKLTSEPQLVPYELSVLCAAAKPTAQELARYGPHTHRWIMVYANPAASAALANPAVREFPPGSAIAKEKLHHPGSAQAEGAAFMVKRPKGEFKSSNGWEFLYHPAYGTKPTYDTCMSCHRAGATKDYVFGSYRHAAAPK